MKYSAVFSILILLSCSEASDTFQSAQPNILLILTDDQGWGDLSIHGNKDLHTPHIDELFRHGVEFDRFYVSPVCSPTRAELLTGRYHVRGGVYSTSAGGERLDLDEETVAELLSRSGYATGAFGKWHNGTQYPYHPNARGFDEYYGFASGHWGHYYNPILEHNQQIVKGEGYLTDDLTNKAMDFISTSVKSGRPFFAFVPLNIPHSPMQVPDAYWSKFERKSLQMNHPDQDKNSILHTRAALAMCENIDMNVGRLSKHLKQLEIEENTIVIYFSDNGPNGDRWNNCMKGRKGSTDEGGVRSPLAIQWKNTIPTGKKVETIAGAIDLLPTVLDLCNIQQQPRHKLDGISLSQELLQSNVKAPHRYIYSHWRGKVSSRSQQYRLSHDDMLFDIIHDPCQKTNLSESEIEIFEEMMSARKIWIDEVLAELPEIDSRTFTVGHPSSQIDHLPARDAIVTGQLKRSNRYPNDSFWQNWASKSDSIKWNVEVLEAGKFNVSVYYTCQKDHLGGVLKLTANDGVLLAKVELENDPPLIGMAEDRSPRAESYVKDFKPLDMGVITLNKGMTELSLSPETLVGGGFIDFRLLLLQRV